jgi:integrase
MSHIQKRKTAHGTKYLARYLDPAKRERSRMFTRRIDAARWLADMEVQLARGDWLDPASGQVLFSEWSERWLATRHDLRQTTVIRLRAAMREQVLPTFGARPLKTISHQDVVDWIDKLATGGRLAAASIRKAHWVLKACLEAAVRDRRLSTNPATGVALPKASHRDQQFLSASEVDELATVMPPEFRAFVYVAAFCGLRFGELAALTRGSVDTLRREIKVSRTAVDIAGAPVTFGESKTRRSRRTVPVPSSVMREIEAHLAAHVGPGADALMFTSPEGGPIRRGSFRRVWLPAVKAIGRDGLRVHDLRHSFVALWISAGAHAKEISEWAGHSSIQITMDRYGHLLPDDRQRAADRMDALLAGSQPTPAAAVLPLRGGEVV